MKTSLFTLMFASVVGFSQTTEKNDWENPEVFSVNALAPHTLLVPFKSENDISFGEIKSSPNYKSLNGLWKFKWSINTEKRPKDFY